MSFAVSPSFVVRPLPALDPSNVDFWTGGEHGELRLRECSVCRKLLHPSQTVCPACLQSDCQVIVVSGRGVVVGWTRNEQSWLPGMPPPYVVAIVALAEDSRVRLTTNIVGCGDDEIRVGLPVRAVFVQQDDVWFPLFEPDPESALELPPPTLPKITARAMASTGKFEERVAITGIGMSEIGRRLRRPPVSLTVEACQAAVADAGLTLADIDGLATWPGAMMGAGGISEGGIPAVEEALGIHPVWHSGGVETSAQTGSIVAAMLAVASGLCRHVLCFRTVWEASYTDLMRTGQLSLPDAGRVGGDMQWRIPFGAASASNWIAMYASQYLDRFGANRQTLGWIALNGRRNAALNPQALYRESMTMDDYMSARMVTTPFGLYDCDVPCDGATAIIVSAVETAADLRQTPVLVEAVGTQIGERQSWDQGTITHLTNIFGAARHLWSRTDLRPADVDVAEIYDGFTFNCLSWLEALGFCGIGEAPDFLEGGHRIALGGELPVNTHGGQLSAGRTHGYGFVHEAVVQLRGDAGARQVPGARVAAVSVGGGIPGGAFLFRTG